MFTSKMVTVFYIRDSWMPWIFGLMGIISTIFIFIFLFGSLKFKNSKANSIKTIHPTLIQSFGAVFYTISGIFLFGGNVYYLNIDQELSQGRTIFVDDIVLHERYGDLSKRRPAVFVDGKWLEMPFR